MAVETPESSSTEIGTLTLCAGIASSLVVDRIGTSRTLAVGAAGSNRLDARVQQLAPAHFGEGKQ